MSLSQKIAAALDALRETPDLPLDVSVEEGNNSLRLHVTASGPVGVSFDSLVFATSEHAGWSPESLSAWANRIVSRLTYLMEPLVVLEIDSIGGEAELRSKQPTNREGRSSYYEIRLHHQGTLHLNRVTYDQQSRSRQISACHMTVEALERLADDLAASVA